MAFKIFKKTNYFYIVDSATNVVNEGLAKDVKVKREKTDSTSFSFENVNGIQPTQRIAFADIVDENGDAYTDLATFVAWYEDNTGFSSAVSPALPTAPTYIRPSDWLPIDNLVNEGDQKFVGLHLINEYSNFVSLTAAGNYTVNWGDGIVENFASGVQAYHIFNYADFVGTESERGYRQTIVTVTPQAGQNMTSINLNKKHNQVGLQKYASGWLDIKMSAPFLTTLYISEATTYVNHYNLEQFDFVGENLLTSCSKLFYDNKSLSNVKNINTALVTDMNGMFSSCYSLQKSAFQNTKISISYQNCSLSKEALVEIFQNLYSPVTSTTITITGNWGASLLTADDRLIATSKGWTIAG